MPTALSTLFCDLQSVGGLLGATGIRLRFDDDGTTTGSITGATNASPIVITATSHGLNTGDVVQISGVGGNTWANGVWVITRVDANSFSLNSSTGINTYTTGGTWQGITYPESKWLVDSLSIGTAKVMRYCQLLYDVSDLAGSWSAANWASICACHWICAHRMNPIPGVLMNLYLEALDEMTAVKNQEMVIEDIGYRNEVCMSFSALRLDNRFTIKKLRVETVLSNRNKAQYPQKQDFGAVLIGPYELDNI